MQHFLKFFAFILIAFPGMPRAHEQDVVDVQRALANKSMKRDIVFDGGCSVAQSIDMPLRTGQTAGEGFFPADTISVYYANNLKTKLDVSKASVIILKQPQHGRVRQLSLSESNQIGVGPESGPLLKYYPGQGYLGPDNATLMVELDGKRHKVRMRFYVVKRINDSDWYGRGTPATHCAESRPNKPQ